MSKFDSVATELAMLFHRFDWQWNEYGVPDRHDIISVCRQLSNHLDELPEGSQVEMGRMMLRKGDDGEIGVYVLMEEYDA